MNKAIDENDDGDEEDEGEKEYDQSKTCRTL